MAKLDYWILRQFNAIVHWGWERHEIKKIEWMRYSVALWALSGIGMRLAIPPSLYGELSLGLGMTVLALLQWQAEMDARQPTGSHNRKVIASLGLWATLAVRMFFLTMTLVDLFGLITGERDGLFSVIGSLSADCWIYFNYCFMPVGPSKRVKREAVSLKLSPIPVRSR